MANDEVTAEPKQEPAPNRRVLGPIASTVLGTLVGCAFFLAGYLLAVGDQESFAVVMFVLVPSASGFAIAMVVERGKTVATCCMTTCVLTLLMLIGTGWEGYICCAMAAPLLVAGMAIGAILGYVVRVRILDKSRHVQRNTTLLILVGPMLVVSANEVEKPFRSVERVETFSTTIEIAAPPAEVWPRLVRMSGMNGDKPFLLRIGLPVPNHCTLESESVGAQRTCHFDQGVINQEVTEWQNSERMTVKTTGSTLPGRHWLTFKDATYELTITPTGTRVERLTSIGSKLYPRCYWRPFEAWGVESEHEYVLTSLKRAVDAREYRITNPSPCRR
jgi:Polyketide cyclase / dehydrase and lipid transport